MHLKCSPKEQKMSTGCRAGGKVIQVEGRQGERSRAGLGGTAQGSHYKGAVKAEQVCKICFTAKLDGAMNAQYFEPSFLLNI